MSIVVVCTFFQKFLNKLREWKVRVPKFFPWNQFSRKNFSWKWFHGKNISFSFNSRSSGDFRRKQNDISRVLISIVVLFFFGHVFRIWVNIYKWANNEEYIYCKYTTNQGFNYPYRIQILKGMHDIAIMLNSAMNFFIYFFVGNKFKRELYKLFGIKVRM